MPNLWNVVYWHKSQTVADAKVLNAAPMPYNEARRKAKHAKYNPIHFGDVVTVMRHFGDVVTVMRHFPKCFHVLWGNEKVIKEFETEKEGKDFIEQNKTWLLREYDFVTLEYYGKEENTILQTWESK
jgi:hypothetical protein